MDRIESASDPSRRPLEAAAFLEEHLRRRRPDAEDHGTQALIRALLIATIDAFVVLVHRDGTIIEATAAALRTTGVERTDAVGRRIWELPIWGTPLDAESVRAAALGAGTGEAVRTRVDIAPLHGAAVRSVGLHARALRTPEGRVAFVMVQAVREGQDAPRRPREPADDAAAMARQLAELAELRQRLVDDLAHDMREPLLSVMARAERLLGHDDEAVRQEARETRAAALTSLMQLEEMRDLSGLQHRRTQLRLGDCDVAGLVRSVARQFEPVASGRGLELVVESPGRLPASADAEKLTSVLSNLLGNAIRYAPPGGRVRASLRVDDGMLQLEVADSGPGIPPAEREAVFQRAWRGPRSTRRPDGRGLGLAIVRQHTELHRGSIHVDDAPEGGALLVVRLPYIEPEHQEPDTTMRDLVNRQLTTEVVVADLQRRFGRDLEEGARPSRR